MNTPVRPYMLKAGLISSPELDIELVAAIIGVGA